jgi:transposase InsO family protein
LKNKLLKTLRSNNGGECISNAFNQFCRDNGITRQLTVPYTLEQNGVIEWKNRSLQECVKSMLKQAKLPNYLGTIVYLQNRTLIKAIARKTPDEMWTCEKTYVAHLKVFGCQAYAHVPKQKRQKLDSKSKECIFMGYT